MFGALYLRISRDKGENEDTLQNHREIMRSFCLKHGYTFEVYEEIVSGGTHEIENRPQLEKLISKIETYECIFAVSLDRLSRNGLVSQTIKQLCIDYNIKIITPSQLFDLANKQEDRILFDVSSMFATMEYEMIGKRNKLNKLQRAKRGEWVSGGTPFGYKRDPSTKKLVIYEPEAKVVRYIFKLHLQGFGSRKIVDILNNEGYIPKRSKAWSIPSVKRIIRNEVYKGTIVFNDRKKIKKHGKYMYKTVETIVCENAHPAIIPCHEWESANKERETRAKICLREKTSQEAFMLKDILFCGICGRKLTIRKERNGTRTIKSCEYLLPHSPEKCQNSGMKVEYLEQEIVKTIKTYKLNLQMELMKVKKSERINLKVEWKNHLEQLNAQIENIKNHQQTLLNLALEGIFSTKEIYEQKQKLAKQLEQLCLKKDDMIKASAAIKPFEEQVPSIVSLLDAFEVLHTEEQNRVLKQVIKKIYYSRKIPKDIKKLSTRNTERRTYPFYYEIEYFH